MRLRHIREVVRDVMQELYDGWDDETRTKWRAATARAQAERGRLKDRIGRGGKELPGGSGGGVSCEG